MFKVRKTRDDRALRATSNAIWELVSSLKMHWYGNTSVNITRLSNTLFDSYVQGFLYSTANNVLEKYISRHVPKKEKISMLERAFSQGFGVEREDIEEWIQNLRSKIDQNTDKEFQRGLNNGSALATLNESASVSSENQEIRRLLERARSMPDPSEWLITKTWFGEFERLKPTSGLESVR